MTWSSQCVFSNNKLFQSWTEVLFLERIWVWERTSNYLIQEGWTALTDKAVRQEVPYVLEDVSGFLEPDLWIIASPLEGLVES